MAITSLDLALAGMQQPRPYTKAATPALVIGHPQSMWYVPGCPGVGTTPPAATAGGLSLVSTAANIAGQMPHTDAAANAYLARLSAVCSQPGVLLLCDRLAHNSSISAGTAILDTVTTAQTITSAALPARDNSGTVNGDGVQWGVEVVTATGIGTPTITLSYTNQLGTAGQASTNIDATVATSAAGMFHRMSLAGGDTGMRSIQSLTLSATWTSGQIALVAYRVLASVEIVNANVPNAVDALTSGFPRLFNGVVPFFIFIPSSTTAANISGTYSETQG